MPILVVQLLAPTNAVVAKRLLIVVQFVKKNHWPTHKESCDGHLRKVGMVHHNKARAFHQEKNWPQLLHQSVLALTKLKQLKDRPVQDISDALTELEIYFFGFHGSISGTIGDRQGMVLIMEYNADRSSCR